MITTTNAILPEKGHQLITYPIKHILKAYLALKYYIERNEHIGYLQTIYFRQKSILPCKKVLSIGFKLYTSWLLLKGDRFVINIILFKVAIKKKESNFFFKQKLVFPQQQAIRGRVIKSFKDRVCVCFNSEKNKRNFSQLERSSVLINRRTHVGS